MTVAASALGNRRIVPFLLPSAPLRLMRKLRP